MTIDCSLYWQEISPVMGPFLRPGGTGLTDRALGVCNLPEGSCIVDIGCGAGGTLEYLQRNGRYHLVGLDPSESLLNETGQRLGRQCLVRGKGEVLPFKNGSTDALVCECVLSILTDRIAALAEFARVLNQAGFLVVSDVFNQGGTKQEEHGVSSQRLPSQGLLTREGLWGLLADLGFSVLLWEEHKTVLKEFLARMILSGKEVPESWRCGQGQGRNNGEPPRISYFLLVARKESA
jgi:ubiquinone/menaquinone biosynthesis C-methylase UbiE